MAKRGSETIDIRDPNDRSGGDGRGRAADTPAQIPPKGWKDVLIRAKGEVKEDNITILAAGVAFYLMLSLFPFAIAGISVYGLAADPSDVTELVEEMSSAVPDEVATLLEEQLGSVTESSGGALTFGLIGSVLFALWSASKGASAIIKSTNVAFDEQESRGWLRLKLLSLAFTLAFLVFLVGAVFLIVVLPQLLGDNIVGTVFSVLRWPLLGLLAVAGLAALYRYAPDRDNPRWQWVSTGALFAAVAWLVGSAGFAVYANNFGSYNETYGSLSAIIVLLLWLWVTALVILVGAEINAETERQTAKDSTTGPEKPMGERDAAPADQVGAPAGAR